MCNKNGFLINELNFYRFLFILFMMSNLLSCSPDSASLGAALRAAHGWLCNKEGRFVPISCLYGDKLDKTSLSAKLAFPAGDADLLSKYTMLVNKRMQIEKNLVEKLGRS